MVSLNRRPQAAITSVVFACVVFQQVAFLCAARDVFHFGQKRLFALLQKAVRVGECCVQDNMFSVAELRDQLAEETGYYVAMNRVNGDFAFQETKRVVDEVTVIYLWALNNIYRYTY